MVWPFIAPEPSLGVTTPRVEWHPSEPNEIGKKFRAALEALAYLISHGVREHEDAGQKINRITVSGGIARSQLMCEILFSVQDGSQERCGGEVLGGRHGRWDELHCRSPFGPRHFADLTLRLGGRGQ